MDKAQPAFALGQLLAVEDGLVDARRLFQRRDAQLLVENTHALAVLAQGRVALAGVVIEQHQPAVSFLQQRVERQPAPRVLNGFLSCPAGLQTKGQFFERQGQLAPQCFFLKKLPFFEVGAVAQVEAGHKRFVVQLRGFFQGLQTVRADLLRAVRVRRERAEQAMKLAHVQPEIGLWGETNRLAGNLERAACDVRLAVFPFQCAVEGGKGAAQGCPRAGLVIIGPQQRGQAVTLVRATGHCQVGHQRGGLARIDFRRRAVHLDARRAKQVQD